MREPSEGGDTEISVSLRDVLGFLLRGLPIAAVVALVVGIGVFRLSERAEPEYRAEATVLAARSGDALSQFGLSPVTAAPLDGSAYSAAAQSDQVLVDALATLGTESPSDSDIRQLRGAVSVVSEEQGRDSNLLRVEGRAPSPDVASARANAVAESLVAWDRSRAVASLERAVTALDEQIDALSEQIQAMQAAGGDGIQEEVDGLVRLRAEQQQQLSYARALVASADGLLSVLQPAGTTPRQVAPRPLLSAVIATVLAVTIVYGLLLLRNALSLRMRSADEVAAVSGLPIVGQFPPLPRNHPRVQEAANYLRTNLLSATAEDHPRVFMVTSAHDREGKSAVSVQLAEGLVRSGHRTLLVDCDLRRPSIASHFPKVRTRDYKASTTAWLLEPSEERSVVRVTISGTQTLDFIAQYEATADAPELLGRGFSRALDMWKRKYDVIVIDSSPVRAVADPLMIAPFCTGTVLVVDRKRTNRQELDHARTQLARVDARLLGVVVNRDGTDTGLAGYGRAYGPQAQPFERTAASSRVKVTELPSNRR